VSSGGGQGGQIDRGCVARVTRGSEVILVIFPVRFRELRCRYILCVPLMSSCQCLASRSSILDTILLCAVLHSDPG